MKKSALILVLVFIMGIFAFGASAEESAVSSDKSAAPAAVADGEFDFLRFAKERVLPDFHPTVKIEDAQADFDEKPFDKGEGVKRAKVGIFYKGWIQQHSMLIEMDYRSEDRKVRVNVLKDTNGLNLRGAKFFKEGEWVSLAEMGWK